LAFAARTLPGVPVARWRHLRLLSVLAARTDRAALLGTRIHPGWGEVNENRAAAERHPKQ